MGLLKKFLNQTRKPEGFLGKIILKGMNFGHAKGADWAMSYLDGLTPSGVVDLGCGGGRNAAVLLRKYPSARVTAVDYSPLSVARTSELNKDAISAGRCVVLEGNVTSLPFEAAQFDIATAFETIYFWPGLKECFTEVARILRPGGRFLIANETGGTDPVGRKFEKIIDGMKVYTQEEIMEALKGAGFSKVRCEHHPSLPWITVLAEK
ncbi:MAG: class I SAM-dependent methyltransferase [Fretibacterium sp.]|nr:class I SAM-dependent methyltransferase [Fretibacterium sp.]